MVETVEVRDSRTGETIECYYLDDAVNITGYCRRTIERRVEEGRVARFHHRGLTVHPVEQINSLRVRRDGVGPGGARPNPKPRPTTNPKGGAQ